MGSNCQLVVFSDRAYNAIIRESFDKDPIETGGILLGHILDNGIWIVMEVLPPGPKSIFQYAYFEYDEAFVNYLAQSVANQYKRPLDLLGLWHRHPASMDVFSSTDDGTNATFARLNEKGAISALVNIDPTFRITMYHLDHSVRMSKGRPEYERIDVEVGNDIIPAEYFEYRYVGGHVPDLISGKDEGMLPEIVEEPATVSQKQSPNTKPVSGGDSKKVDKQESSVDDAHCQGASGAFIRTLPGLQFLGRINKSWLYVIIAVFAVVLIAISVMIWQGLVGAIKSL